jgi:regulator of sigma E protease
MFLTIVSAVIIFCLLIFVHEFGHFATAKAVGIKVNAFAIGMGPVLLKFTKGDTEYSLRAFPIGGYVKMEGEEENSEDARAFNNKPTWAKALVVVAGSVMNLLTAIIILTLVLFSIGYPTNVVGEVSTGDPAILAGVLAGDKIVSIENQPIKSWDDILNGITESKGETLRIAVERDGKTIDLVTAVKVDETGRRLIGIAPAYAKDPWQALKMGVTGTFSMAVMMLEYLGVLVTGGGSADDLMGPVGIVSTIGDFAKMGFAYLANLTALISLNLAIVNMLPLPALDGGRLLFMLIRMFTGKAITDDVENKIHFAGLMMLFGLMIWITVKDVGRLFFN